MWSVFFVFLSYLDRNFVKGDLLSRALDAERESKEMFSMLNGTFCAKMSTVRESFLYQVSDGAEVVRSVVGPTGKLVNCSVVVNQMLAKSFMHECRLGLKEQRADRQLETRFTRMSEAKLTCREFKEKSERSGSGGGGVKGDDTGDSALQDGALKRSKRGFTYPGTLWCGAGNMADDYSQLGEFAETDSCCRIHDHCPHVIHAFSSNYGHTNFKWHSICHCDCDDALRGCLRKVNDTSSRVVGQAFFNVIGVPCFDLAYEEQCVERHWYGMCKRYEKLPIAVLKEAIPYDFGGIDVIDKLNVASESKKSKEQEKPESATQSTMSGPDEPSLGNVVTAAEDFIKVLATVSTSQSSAAAATDSDKGETQSSEKKRKNAGKKRKHSKKQKGKGKGRKRKQKAEEGAAVSPSGGKAEEVMALSNFISESHKHKQSSRNTNRVGDGEYKLGEKEEPFNEVMKDEPAADQDPVSITSPKTIQKKPAESTEETPLSTPKAVIPHEANTRMHRKGRRKKSKKISLLSSVELLTNTSNNMSAISGPHITTITSTPRPEQQSLVASTASAPIIIPKVKRNRSKEQGDRAGRKKRRKVSSASSIVGAAGKNSTADNLKVIPLAVPLAPTTEQKVSHKMDVYGGGTSIPFTVLNSSFSVLKRQKLKGSRSRRRKTALPLSSENPLFHNGSENVLPIPTPEAGDAPKTPATDSAGGTERHGEWRFFTTITAATSIITKQHRQTIRQQREKATAALGSIPRTPEQKSMRFTTTPPNVATTEELNLQRSEKPSVTSAATVVMSPIQLSIERVKAQFTRKKKRKAALAVRQQ